jgi:2-dehydropantoate 2-reductase
MLRDIECGAPTEGDHVLSDMIARASAPGVDTSLLAIACTHVAAYEASRIREAAVLNTD